MAALAAALVAVSCGGSDAGRSADDSPGPATSPATVAATPTSAVPPGPTSTPPSTPRPASRATSATSAAGAAAPATWTYWLSEIDLDAIGAIAPPIAVIDYSRDGTDDSAIGPADLDRLRGSMSEPALVIAYLSIGEAEDYRYYWRPEWRPGEPEWLDAENPDWAGNFKVRYWDPGWRRVVYGGPSAYLDRIIDAGFDGAYLDIVDAYEYYADLGRDTGRQEMIEFITMLAAYARERQPGFLIIPQNAPELGADAAYLDAVDGVGIEGVYFGYDDVDQPTAPADASRLEADLARFVDAGMLVLSVDYAVSPDHVAEAYRRARAQGFVPTVAAVELDGPPVPDPDR